MNKRRRNRLKDADTSQAKVGWRVSEWADAVGLCRATVYNRLLAAGAIESVKIGAARVITTSPAEFLASLRGEAA